MTVTYVNIYMFDNVEVMVSFVEFAYIFFIFFGGGRVC